MKLFFFASSIIFTISQTLASAPVKQLPAITESFKDVNGNKVEFVNGTQGSLYIFTSEHCPYDIEWRSKMAAEAHFAKDKKLNVFILNSHQTLKYEQNNLNNMKKTREVPFKGLNYIQDANQTISSIFKVIRTPVVYLFDSKGLLTFYGKISSSPDKDSEVNYLHKALEALFDSNISTPRETNVLGCLLEKGE